MKTILVIPFFKNEQFIDNFIDYFTKFLSERNVFHEIFIINDCPQSDKSFYLKERCKFINFNYIENTVNIGFLKSANIGFKLANDLDSNLLILNSDTLPYKGAFRELVECLSIDDKIGCIAPRSNNATICNLFEDTKYLTNSSSAIEYESIINVFAKSISIVPKLTYSPVTNGFCLLIKREVLVNFNCFDIEFSPGYEEENDYALRISNHGYRICIANHALVFHYEGESFKLNQNRELIKISNYNKIINRYPYYFDLIKNYNTEITTIAYYNIINSLKNNNNTILIDARNLGNYYNGTNRLIVEIINSLINLNYNIDLLTSKQSLLFHKLNLLERLNLIEDEKFINRSYCYGIKIGQPFNKRDLITVPSNSLISLNIFFDTIAIDCPQVYKDILFINSYWKYIQGIFSNISFISEFSKKQYELRFGNLYNNLSNKNFNLLPLYSKSSNLTITNVINSQFNYKFALVIGNNFTHKGLEHVLKNLPIIKELNYLLLLNKNDTCLLRSDFKFIEPGYLSDELISYLYKNSEFIIFPSFSEGFGFPLVEAIGYRKKIIIRKIPCFIEILNEYKDSNVYKLIFFTETFNDFTDFIHESNNFIFEYSLNKINYNDYMSELLTQINLSNPKNFSFDSYITRLLNINLINKSLDINKINFSDFLYLYFQKKYQYFYKYKYLRTLLKFLKYFYLKIMRI